MVLLTFAVYNKSILVLFCKKYCGNDDFFAKKSSFPQYFLQNRTSILLLYTANVSNTIDQQQRETNTTPSFFVSLGIWFTIICWCGAYVTARFLLHAQVHGF